MYTNNTTEPRDDATEDELRPAPLEFALADDARALREEVASCDNWTIEKFLRHARSHQEMSDELVDLVDRADLYGDALNEARLAKVRDDLDAARDALLTAEQDPGLAAQTLVRARREYSGEDFREGEDRELPIIVALLLHPRNFGEPIPHTVPTLLRQINGGPLAGSHRILNVPLWLCRRIESWGHEYGVRRVERLPGTADPDTLEAANCLWDPRTDGPYDSPSAALEAARLVTR
jgi:hypothetical protein